jgi:hypothetical protein
LSISILLEQQHKGRLWTLCGVVVALLGTFYLRGQAAPDFPEYVSSSVFLGVATLLLLVGNRNIIDPSLIMLIYFALHYSVMLPLYGLRLAWTHFAVFLENNWLLLCDGNFGALLGIAAYGTGLLAANLFAVRKKPVSELCPPESAGRFAFWYGLVGLLGWLIIICSDGSPLGALFGRPAERRSIFGYYQILLFCSITSFILYQVASRGKSFFRLPNLLFLFAVLWMNMVKGARLDLMIILLTAFVINSLLRRQSASTTVSKGSSLVRRVLYVFALSIVGVSLYAFTLYRGDMEAGSIDFADFLHSLADSAGYLIALDRYPRYLDFWNGWGYLHPFVIYIPSALFPAKYDYAWGISEFTEVIFGYSVFNDGSTTSHTYSILGEGYINFGWPGLVATMLFFGFVNRRFFLNACSRNFTMYGAILYAFYYSSCVSYSVKSGLLSGGEFYFQNCLVMFALPLYIIARRRLQKARARERRDNNVMRRVGDSPPMLGKSAQ